MEMSGSRSKPQLRCDRADARESRRARGCSTPILQSQSQSRNGRRWAELASRKIIGHTPLVHAEALRRMTQRGDRRGTQRAIWRSRGQRKAARIAREL